ncbi:MAG: hypothetical protein GC181_06740 [Bacteroidetes bacterium]|nr:hypothetical protein [Bacteroidota bacterium]
MLKLTNPDISKHLGTFLVLLSSIVFYSQHPEIAAMFFHMNIAALSAVEMLHVILFVSWPFILMRVARRPGSFHSLLLIFIFTELLIAADAQDFLVFSRIGYFEAGYHFSSSLILFLPIAVCVEYPLKTEPGTGWYKVIFCFVLAVLIYKNFRIETLEKLCPLLILLTAFWLGYRFYKRSSTPVFNLYSFLKLVLKSVLFFGLIKIFVWAFAELPDGIGWLSNGKLGVTSISEYYAANGCMNIQASLSRHFFVFDILRYSNWFVPFVVLHLYSKSRWLNTYLSDLKKWDRYCVMMMVLLLNF